MKMFYYIVTIIALLFSSSLTAQIVSVGGKFQKDWMFQTTINYPFVFDEDSRHEVMLGLDYTSKNNQAPSGLTPQITYGYYVVDSAYKDFMVMAGVSTGYTVNLNSAFKSQIRVSPFVYAEYFSFLNVKVGYDYGTQINKGYPYVSIGLGGFHMFRHFKIM
ncbi:hypothetical protein H1R17_03105 [Flavobacterium sp. xlx-214]|uniref:hypothetical protein n=1 Tax=unclassified Flavobacterium TaxID=196869 RepID=UPI0013D1689B|nr:MULTISPECIES: hypothetical protein [unclassified Flavobacterium]MBA5793299.1 hypothetical protein [Flavobacterium sp. xlx-221]QMI84137.1 hypothetical protein H1R17_03105 [Flavobacterium sp. xlx-214]